MDLRSCFWRVLSLHQHHLLRSRGYLWGRTSMCLCDLEQLDERAGRSLASCTLLASPPSKTVSSTHARTTSQVRSSTIEYPVCNIHPPIQGTRYSGEVSPSARATCYVVSPSASRVLPPPSQTLRTPTCSSRFSSWRSLAVSWVSLVLLVGVIIQYSRSMLIECTVGLLMIGQAGEFAAAAPSAMVSPFVH